MTKEDQHVVVEVEDPWCGGKSRRQRISFGPRSKIGDVFNRLIEGDSAASTAIICHAFGNESLSACMHCEDGPFGICKVYSSRSNNACSNCIYSGNKRYCEWSTCSDLNDSDNERDIDLDSDNGHDNVPPAARSPRQTRSNPDSGEDSEDPDYVPPRARNGSDYVPPRTRNAGGSRKPASKRHADGVDHNSPPLKRQKGSTPSVRAGPTLSPFIDLTGEDG